MVERFRVELEQISDIELQTNDRAEHFHKAWITLSDSSLQWSHRSSCKIFRFIKLCLTGSASLQDLHKKNFTLFGTDKLRINSKFPFHHSASLLWKYQSWCIRNLYPDCTVYCPEGVVRPNYLIFHLSHLGLFETFHHWR